MAQNNDGKHLRVLEITMVPDVSSAAYQVSAVTYRRDGQLGAGQAIAFTAVAGTPELIVLGEAIPQDVSIIKLSGTIQA